MLVSDLRELRVDDSPDSQEARQLLADRGIDIPVVPESPKGSRLPRLITVYGSLIGIEHIRLAFAG